MPNKSIISLILLTAAVALSSCSAGEKRFTVDMKDADSVSTAALTVVIPQIKRGEKAVGFVLEGISYLPSHLPTVSYPVFGFEDNENDAYSAIELILADSINGEAELRTVSADGEEKTYRSPMSDFRPLLDSMAGD